MRRLLLAALAAGTLAVPLAPAHAECYVRPILEIRDDTLYVTINRGYCQYTIVEVPLPPGLPIPPTVSASADCPSRVLLSEEDGVTYVNVPTGRCTYQSIPLPVPVQA
ncbi:MAG TPA: hypothetical protein VFQ85_13595 [Mycobacteriales bacterium]|jgi:hypothetical protein|nr:hypothetical protein [Mycobacteriales bacterium]